MILSCTFLSDVGGVNAYREAPTFLMSEGDQVDVYIQLRDISVNPAAQGFKPVGRRYMPATGATLSVSLSNSFDDARVVSKVCTQPYASDPSIWKFTILSTDPIKGTRNVQLTLTESAVVKKGIVQAGIRAVPTSEIVGNMGPSPSDYFV
jgi:hypothetical protein